MTDTELFKQVDFVLESVQALSNRRSGLLSIRRQLLKIRKPTTFKNQEMASIIADMLIDIYAPSVRRTMDYQPGTDFHEAHDMFHIPGSGSKNPEYSNF